MKSLQEMLKESFEKSYTNDLDNYIVEGLNIDVDNKTVSLTDAHNSGIDFSLVNNVLIKADMSRNKRKKKVDGMAAVIILQGYLDRL